MRLYLVPNPRNTIGTVDEVDNASYANDQGYFMYHVETPRRKYRFPLAGPSQVTTIYRSNVAARILGSCPTLSARESQTTTPARSWPRRRRRNSDLRDDDEDSLDWDFAPPPTYQDAILSPQTTGELLLGASALSLEYPDRGEKFAEIEFNTYSPTHFRYGERDCVEHDLFEEGSMSFWNYSKRNRVFRATDENTYVWVNSENRQTRLLTNDDRKQPVATFHPGGTSNYSERSSFLEIHPLGKEIIDLIFMTFIFVESLRSRKSKPSPFTHCPPYSLT